MTPERTSRSSADRLTEALPEAMRPFVRIDSAALSPAALAEVTESLVVATQRLATVIRPDRTCNVVFGKRPFHLNLRNGQLVFTPTDDVVQARVNSIIFIDVERLLAYPRVLRVAMLLEELVHVLMGIDDETFVMTVVAGLCPDVVVLDGLYTAIGS